MKKIFAVILIFALAGSMAGCATPLTSAVKKHDLREINALLDSGANINEPGGDPSYPPLVWALRYRYFDVARLLIDRGADVNFWLALQYAAEAGDVNILNLLLEKGAEVNSLGSYGYASPLVAAAKEGKTAVIERLLEKGADLDAALATCTKQSTDWLWGAAYQPCVAILNSVKAKRDEAKQPSKPQDISEDKLAVMVQTAVEKASKDKKETKTSSTISDIEKPSFTASDKIISDNDLAVIIGIEGYQGLPKSDYSYDDAKLVGDYAKALGFKPRNIELLMDERATKSAIEKIIKTWLSNKAKPESRVLVYYSGHGAPEPKTGDAYLVPYDGDPNYLADTGYPLKSLYDSLGKLQVAEITVVLDACFSGAGGRSVLAKGARPLVMVTDVSVISQNMAVLSATQGAQISTSSPEKGHGVFTYYFLKALKDGKKTIAEIYSYIKPLVEDEAKQLNVQQSPSVSPDVEKIRGRFGLRK